MKYSALLAIFALLAPYKHGHNIMALAHSHAPVPAGSSSFAGARASARASSRVKTAGNSVTDTDSEEPLSTNFDQDDANFSEDASSSDSDGTKCKQSSEQLGDGDQSDDSEDDHDHAYDDEIDQTEDIAPKEVKSDKVSDNEDTDKQHNMRDGFQNNMINIDELPLCNDTASDIKVKEPSRRASIRIEDMPYCEETDTITQTERVPFCDEVEDENVIDECPNIGRCPDISVFNEFNVMVFGNFEGSSTVEGRIAVEGDAKFADGFSVGDKLYLEGCEENIVIVKGSASWRVGKNFNGNLVAGNVNNVNSDIMSGYETRINSNAYDFADAKKRVIEKSKELADLNPTVVHKTVDERAVASFTFSGKAAVEVVELEASELGNKIKEFATPVGVSKKSVILFNFKGTSASIKDVNMEMLSKYNVIFNFPEATSLSIEGASIRGAIIAPNADVKDAKGTVWGPIIVKSITGSISYGLKPVLCESNCMSHVPSLTFDFPDDPYGNISSFGLNSSQFNFTSKSSLSKSSKVKSSANSVEYSFVTLGLVSIMSIFVTLF